MSEVASSVIVVCPKAWENSLDEWVKYRARDYQIIKVEAITSPLDLKLSILKAAGQAKFPVAAVLL